MAKTVNSYQEIGYVIGRCNPVVFTCHPVARVTVLQRAFPENSVKVTINLSIGDTCVGIIEAEVILTSPINLPSRMEGEAYVGIVIIGKGKVIHSASVQTSDVPSFTGSVHEKTMAATYFAIVAKGKVHVYLENQSILDFLRYG